MLNGCGGPVKLAREKGSALDYRILGPLDACRDGKAVTLGGEKQRAVLAMLLLHANETVSTDQLIDGLWGERPPPSAVNALQAHVSRLRRALGDSANGSPAPSDGMLVTTGRGYRLRVAPGELDADRFRSLVEQGRRALADGEPREAKRILQSAAELWRGPPLADFTYEPFAQGAIARLEELRLAALEERIEAELTLGADRELVAELAELVEQNPLRERLRGQLMLALYRAGRQAEALEVYQEFRRGLSEQLGLDPGPALRELELAILSRDPSLEMHASGATHPRSAGSSARAREAPPVHRRKVRLAVGSSTLLAMALVAALIALSGGTAAPPAVIAADSVGAISPSGSRISAVVPLPTAPSALAAGAGSVWVASYNAGTISRIDATTQAVVETIPVGSTPSGIAFGAGAVWVANNYGETVSRVGPTVNRVVQTIRVGNGPTGVAVGDGSVWVSNTSDGTLSRISAISGSVTDTIALGGSATGVAAGLGAVWVSDTADRRVLRVDPHTDQVTQQIDVGTGPTAIAVGYGSVWVTNSLDGTVSRIDPQTNQVAATIPVGNGPNAIATGHGAVWVANRYGGSVSRIDPATDTVARTVTVGNHPQGLAILRGLVWAGAQATGAGHRGGTLSELRDAPPGTVDPVLAGNAVQFLQLTNDGLTAYERVGGSDSTQVVPDLAVSLPSPTAGGTTYTFQLRRGIRYSNGQPVRPEDFRRALERDLTLGPNSFYGGPFANVIGGAACAVHPRHCDLSRGVVTDDAADTVTFHLVAPNPEFLARLTLMDAVAVPAGTPYHDIGDHPIPATGPYKFATYTQHEIKLVRNPYFHEWSHAARPNGYPDGIVVRIGASQSAELTAVERGIADYTFDGPPANRMDEVTTRFASQLYVNPNIITNALILNVRVAPFVDIRVRRALNYAIDRAKVARLLGQASQPTCQMLPPYLPGYRRYCPYTLDPNPAGVWHAPNLARAEQLIAASHTRGTPITVWNLGAYQTAYTPVEPYLISLLDKLGYPTTVKDLATDPHAPGRFADSRTRVQAALGFFIPPYLSASQMIETNFACQYFVPDSTGNANFSEFCDPQLDAQINSALAAESNDSPDAAALWALAGRTVTERAPVVALTIPSTIDFVSKRVGNYEYNFQQGVLLDQLWVR
jgi:YVTN family beta-propeller protein